MMLNDSERQQQAPPPDLSLLVQFAIITWEISAPMTLLIGAVVKYALWPASIAKLKASGKSNEPTVFKKPRALLMHNANVIMVMIDVCVLGGTSIPISLHHFSIPVIYGCSYVIFAYLIQFHWHGSNNKKIPAFLYFFMDPTLGNEHTIALYVLLSVLTFFYVLFVGIEHILTEYTILSGLIGRIGFGLIVCCSVCRFHD